MSDYEKNRSQDFSEANHLPERLGSLETAFRGYHDEFIGFREEIKRELHDIYEKISSGAKTNWSTVFAGLMVIGAMYAAAIRPLEKDSDRQSQGAGELAQAVLKQNESVMAITILTHEMNTRQEDYYKTLEDIRINGSEGANTKIVVLQTKVDWLQDEIRELKQTIRDTAGK